MLSSDSAHRSSLPVPVLPISCKAVEACGNGQNLLRRLINSPWLSSIADKSGRSEIATATWPEYALTTEVARR